jgi:hypothetical protein
LINAEIGKVRTRKAHQISKKQYGDKLTRRGETLGLYRERQMQGIGFSELDIDQLRERLRNMSDDQLLKFGKSARYMCSPTANRGKPPDEAFVIQLKEARAEWRRRHPKAEPEESLTTLKLSAEGSPNGVVQSP